MKLIGVDLGTHKIAMAVFIEEPGSGLILADTKVHVAQQLHRDIDLHELAEIAYHAGHFYDVDSVWIEDTIIGNNRKYSIQLAEVKGAVLSQLSRLRMSLGTDIRLVDNTTWKKQVVGDGHASKDQITDYIRVTHPAYAALCGDDQDLYDAVGVGLYGITILGRAKDLHL